MKLLHIVADYGPGDLAFSEMVTALCAHLPEGFQIWGTTVGSFDTLGTGFCVGQLALPDVTQRPKQMLLYVNCAPRRDYGEARKNNQGEKLEYALLKNGVPLLIVNSGYSLSFVRDEIAELWSVHVEREGSQFRSRDLFPPVVGLLACGTKDFLKDQLNPKDTAIIPDYPRNVVVYIDSFKNIKTTIRSSDKTVAALKPGQEIDVTINGITRPVTVATGNFNVREGTMAFSPGSSGFNNRFWEIFLRGGEAAESFSFPKPGTEIHLSIPTKS